MPKFEETKTAAESVVSDTILNDCCSSRRTRWSRAAAALLVLAAVAALVSMTCWFGLKARNEARQYETIGRPAPQRDLVTVTGEGRIKVAPDVAVLDLGMTAERGTVTEAQAETVKVMNDLTAAVKTLGVEAKDVQTANYSVSPAYDWEDGRQSLRGYSVTQSLRVKVRNLDSVSAILAKAAELGANQVGGISFVIDEPESLRAEAREKAIADAQEKAEDLAETVGFDLGKIVSFGEGYSPSPEAYYMADRAMGLGGAVAAMPSIEPGQNEIVVSVSLTYELK